MSDELQRRFSRLCDSRRSACHCFDPAIVVRDTDKEGRSRPHGNFERRRRRDMP